MPSTQNAVNNHEYRSVPITALAESATNPRKRFDAKSLEELAASFKTQGILAPLLVRELEESKYEVVAGARRLRAASLRRRSPRQRLSLPSRLQTHRTRRSLLPDRTSFAHRRPWLRAGRLASGRPRAPSRESGGHRSFRGRTAGRRGCARGRRHRPLAGPKLLAALGGPANLILSDMSPNTTGHRATDHLRIMGLIEAAADFAGQTLQRGGAFVCKAFQGGETAAVIARLKRDYAICATPSRKPAAPKAPRSTLWRPVSAARGKPARARPALARRSPRG